MSALSAFFFRKNISKVLGKIFGSFLGPTLKRIIIMKLRQLGITSQTISLSSSYIDQNGFFHTASLMTGSLEQIIGDDSLIGLIKATMSRRKIGA